MISGAYIRDTRSCHYKAFFAGSHRVSIPAYPSTWNEELAILRQILHQQFSQQPAGCTVSINPQKPAPEADRIRHSIRQYEVIHELRESVKDPLIRPNRKLSKQICQRMVLA